MTKKKTEPKKMGRPTDYNPKIVTQILQLASNGKTNQQIADKVGISVDTIYDWKLKYIDFSEALGRCKAIVDDSVESALLHRALGYQHKAIKIHFDQYGSVSVHEYDEHYPPDTNACLFWLKNRRPKDWRDVSRQELTGKDGDPLEMNAPQVIITLPDNGRTAKDGG